MTISSGRRHDAAGGRRSSPRQGRFTLWIARRGDNPDPRFTLANERTFLAWIRTALALLSAGVALQLFALEQARQPWGRTLAVALISLGMVTSVVAAVRWLRVELAMRQSLTLPAPAFLPVVVALIVGGSLVALVLVVADGW